MLLIFYCRIKPDRHRISLKLAKHRINLTRYEEQELVTLINKPSTAQSIVIRAKIIFLANGEQKKNKEIVSELKVQSQDISRWTKRWLERSSETVLQRLSDLPRSGAPDTFTPEQICKMVALVCEDPADYDRPISHWSQNELVDEMIKQGIVKSISQSQVCRILQQMDLQPHRIRYWLNSKADERKDERINDICKTYFEAIKKKTKSPLVPMK